MRFTADPLSSPTPGRKVKAINIDLEAWHAIMDKLLTQGWTCIDQYDGMDAGIDYNSYTFQKERDIIKFEWFVYTDGEFTCTFEILKEVERITQKSFEIDKKLA